MPNTSSTIRNDEMNLAWQFIAQTNVSVFLTGKAGTGKTTFLRKLKELTPKRMVVLAPTGVAAINANGQTIHSFFQLPFGPNIPGVESEKKKSFRMSQDKKNLIKTLDLLVIDEISMVRCDLLDSVDAELRKYRDHTRPFGGVQLLLIGDLQQLSPVAREDEWRLLSPYYETPYFFGSRALKQIKYVTVELKHIYRQTDLQFVDLLAAVRTNNITKDVLTALNSHYVPGFIPPKEEEWIRLTTHNRMAQEYNENQLRALPHPSRSFTARIKDNFPESNYPADVNLVLKIGAQVMFIKNDPSGSHVYYNGKMGVVKGYDDEGNIVVFCKEGNTTVNVPPVTWENMKYKIDEDTKEITEEVEGTFTQYPLRLAWAITVHKSQGLTFDHAVIDINASFAHGQVYVALSRCRTLEGMVLSQPVNAMSIIKDANVDNYITSQLENIGKASDQLPQLRYDYFLELLTEMFSLRKLQMDYLYLQRVASENLSGSHPGFVSSMRNAAVRLQKELIDVADKFSAQYHTLMQQSQNFMKDPQLHDRIKAACGYFGPRLREIFSPILEESVLNIGNKQVAQRYNNALGEFKLTYKIKVGVFERLLNDGFTIQHYLSAKAVSALDNPDEKPKKQQRQSKSSATPETAAPASASSSAVSLPTQPTKKPKAKKGDSMRHTLSLYDQGKSVKEIAEERGLSTNTIESHLATFIPTGEIKVNDLVSTQHQKFIRGIINSFDQAYTLSEVKEMLPDDYTYLEIKLVQADMQREL